MGWLATHSNRERLKIDYSLLSETYTNQPVMVKIDNASGVLNLDRTLFFDVMQQDIQLNMDDYKTIGSPFAGNNGDPLNSHYWSTYRNDATINDPEVQSGACFLNRDRGGGSIIANAYVEAQPRFRIEGDFVIEIEYSGFVADTPGSQDGYCLDFTVVGHDQELPWLTWDTYAAMKVGYFTSNKFRSYYTRNAVAGSNTDVSRTNNYGAVKIERASDVITFYIQDGDTGGVWTLHSTITNWSSKSVQFYALLRLGTGTTDFGLEAYITRFQIMSCGGLYGDSNNIGATPRIVFTDSDGTTPLPTFVEYIDYKREKAVFWVKLPTVSHVADTFFYMYYDPLATPDYTYTNGQESAVTDSVFPSGSYQLVWQPRHRAMVGYNIEVSQYRTTLTNLGEIYDDTDGKWGKLGTPAQRFSRGNVSNRYVDTPDRSSLRYADGFTLVSRCMMPALPAANTSGLLNKYWAAGSGDDFSYGMGMSYESSRKFFGSINNNTQSGIGGVCHADSMWLTGTWYTVFFVWDDANNQGRLYVDGVRQASTFSYAGEIAYSSGNFYIGAGWFNKTQAYSEHYQDFALATNEVWTDAKAAFWYKNMNDDLIEYVQDILEYDLILVDTTLDATTSTTNFAKVFIPPAASVTCGLVSGYLHMTWNLGTYGVTCEGEGQCLTFVVGDATLNLEATVTLGTPIMNLSGYEVVLDGSATTLKTIEATTAGVSLTTDTTRYSKGYLPPATSVTVTGTAGYFVYDAFFTVDTDLLYLELDSWFITGEVYTLDTELPIFESETVFYTGINSDADIELFKLEAEASFGSTLDSEIVFSTEATLLTGNVLTADIALLTITPDSTMSGENLITFDRELFTLTSDTSVVSDVLITGDSSIAFEVDATMLTGRVLTADLELFELIAEDSEMLTGNVLTADSEIAIEVYGVMVTGLSATASDRKVLVVNTNTLAIWEYEDYNFNSFAEHAGTYLGADSTGIYELAGDKDKNTDNIAASITYPTIDVSEQVVSRLIDIWVTGRKSGKVKATITYGEGSSASSTDLYPSNTNNLAKEFRFKLPRGMKERYYSVTISNVGGSDFDIDAVSVTGERLPRRVR